MATSTFKQYGRCRAKLEDVGRRAVRRRRILRELFAAGGDSVRMQPPFFCDFGSNIHLGERVFFNFNGTVLDVCLVHIGSAVVVERRVIIWRARNVTRAG